MKKLLSILFVIMLAISLIGGAASANSESPAVLYGVNAADDGLSIINPETGEVTFIGLLDPDPYKYATPVAMAVHPSTGEIYVWNNSNILDDNVIPVETETTGVLLIVNRCTGLATPVDPEALGQGVLQALAFAPDGTLYGLGEPLGQYALYTIDLTTGIKTKVADLGPAVEIYAADFSPGGVLYGVEALFEGTERLFTIDTTNGEMTLVAYLSEDIGMIGSIVFDEEGNLIGSAFDYPDLGNILFDIDPSTGNVSDIRQLTGGFAPQGMGFSSPCDDSATGMGDRIRPKGTWFMYNMYPEIGGDGCYDIHAGNPVDYDPYGSNIIGTYCIASSPVDDQGDPVSSGWYVATYDIDETIDINGVTYNIVVVEEHLAISDIANFKAKPGRDDNVDFEVPFYDEDGEFFVFSHFEVEYRLY